MAVDAYIFKLHRGINARKVRILSLYLYIAQSEVADFCLRLAFAESQGLVVGLVVGHVGLGSYETQAFAVYVDVFDDYVAHCAEGLLVGAFEGEELCPGLEFDYCAACACDILHGDVLVELIGVGAHLETEYSAVGKRLAVAQSDILGVNALAAHCENAMQGRPEGAVLNKYILHYTVFD